MKRFYVDRFVSRGSRDIRAAVLREVDGFAKPSDRAGAVHEPSHRVPDQGRSFESAQDGQTWQERPGREPRRRRVARSGSDNER